MGTEAPRPELRVGGQHRWPRRTEQGHLKPNRDQRLQQLRFELAARFQPICRDMSDEEFAKLVDEMARFRLKYEDLEAELAQRSPTKPERPRTS
jgi:hypothetical protein